MAENEIRRPTLIVVTGRPGVGKTTLTHKLARALRTPAICRDEIKEGLVNTTADVQEASLKWRTYEDFLRLLNSCSNME